MVDMFDSVKYNLTNPALTDDIGESLGTGTTMPMAPSPKGVAMAVIVSNSLVIINFLACISF